MPWKEAIIEVLPKDGSEMHYAEIAKAVVDAGLRTNVGATPAATVAAVLSQTIPGSKSSPFVAPYRGYYALKKPVVSDAISALGPKADEEAGFINAFGMYWKRERIHWDPTTPQLLGRQQLGSDTIDFCRQKGVYLLYDGDRVVYVGRAIDQPMGVRLKQHTSDRLEGRWDRFSWFGVLQVGDDGGLGAPPTTFDLANLIATMEALLIEGLEPPPEQKARG